MDIKKSNQHHLGFDLNTLAFLGLGDNALFHSRLCRLVSGSYSKIHDSSPVTTLFSKLGSVSSCPKNVSKHLHTPILLSFIQQPWYHFCTDLPRPQIFRNDAPYPVVALGMCKVCKCTGAHPFDLSRAEKFDYEKL